MREAKFNQVQIDLVHEYFDKSFVKDGKRTIQYDVDDNNILRNELALFLGLNVNIFPAFIVNGEQFRVIY